MTAKSDAIGEQVQYALCAAALVLAGLPDEAREGHAQKIVEIGDFCIRVSAPIDAAGPLRVEIIQKSSRRLVAELQPSRGQPPRLAYFSRELTLAELIDLLSTALLAVLVAPPPPPSPEILH